MWIARVILVNAAGGLAQVGLFTAAQKWSTLIMFIPAAMGSIVLPVMSDLHATGDDVAFRKVFKFNLLVSLGAVGVPALVLILFRRMLMGTFGPAYVSATPVLIVLALTTIPMVINAVLGQVAVSMGRIWTRFVIDVALAATLVITALAAIPAYHALGLALAYAAAFTLSAAVLLIVVNARSMTSTALQVKRA
jgi:O-antigen/teichoic acid export membrane protein